MKKVIANRLYDTDTSQLIGECKNSSDLRDFFHEVLYRSPWGQYFIFGQGLNFLFYNDLWKFGKYGVNSYDIVLVTPGIINKWLEVRYQYFQHWEIDRILKKISYKITEW